MFDDFEYNPVVDVIATEFTFHALDPGLAIHVAQSLTYNIDYDSLNDAHWYYVENDGKPSLCADHQDRPLKTDFHNLGQILEKLRADSESLFEAYNKVFGTSVEFDGIGIHFGDDNELSDWD